MKIDFIKMHGTGNDFIIVDQFEGFNQDLNRQQIHDLCNRRFGIGADGLIIIRPHETVDFQMLYYNSDGGASSMCGNGGRCIVKYAYLQNYVKEQTQFLAPDGIHKATIDKNLVSLKMSDVNPPTLKNENYVLDTGSPHFVQFGKDIDSWDVDQKGSSIRYSKDFKEEGINVNFVERISEDLINIRTYERGVEAETFSCGTGVTAGAIVSSIFFDHHPTSWKIKTKGGQLEVKFETDNGKFQNVYLIGPAQVVFSGTIDI